MSLRPREALEAGTTFSLRDVVPPPMPVPTGVGKGSLSFRLDLKANKGEGAAGPPVPTSAPAGLNLRFTALKAQQTPAEAPPAPCLCSLNPATFGAGAGAGTRRTASPAAVGAMGAMAAGEESPPSPASAPQQPQPQPQPQQRRGGSQRASAAATAPGPYPVAADAATQRQDVMRLTAYVDDLTSRLQSTQAKLESTQLKLARTSQVLFAERQTAGQNIGAYKKDLAVSREAEAALRAELKARPTKVEAKASAFGRSVESALHADERVEKTARTIAELETKVGALQEMKATLEAELNTISEAKEAASEQSKQLHHLNIDSSQRLEAFAGELEGHDAKVAAAVCRTDAAEAAAAAAEARAASCTERATMAYEAALRAEAESEMRQQLAAEGAEAAVATMATAQLKVERLEEAAAAASARAKGLSVASAAAAEVAAIPEMRLPPPATKAAAVAEAEAVIADGCGCGYPKAGAGAVAGAGGDVSTLESSRSSTPGSTSGDESGDEDVSDSARRETKKLLAKARVKLQARRAEEELSACAAGVPAPFGLSEGDADHAQATKAFDPFRAAPAPPASARPLRGRMRISGALAPEPELRMGAAAVLANLPFSASVSAVAACDAPLAIGATHVSAEWLAADVGAEAPAGEAGDATSLLVNAVVADLKAAWQSSLSFQPATRFVAPLA